MKIPLRPVIVLLLLTLFAGAVGGALGVAYGNRVSHTPTNLDTLIHHELDLTAAQNDRIEALEAHYAEQRKVFQTEMQAANHDLAAALDNEHAYGPQAQAAIDRFHHAEEALQVATIKHVLAMRSVLNQEQSEKFDRAIHQALTAGRM
ncbi:MAG: periplasmic heavy metal sensor [Alphaproteobacteria bacterium]|nr:periplasmic heavy metal sensor [Alphaproteobacteria bacterium]